jgi:hypothetical protein
MWMVTLPIAGYAQEATHSGQVTEHSTLDPIGAVTPDEPPVTPDEPPVPPDEPSVMPDEPSVPPNEPSVPPDEPAVMPDEPSVTPDEPYSLETPLTCPVDLQTAVNDAAPGAVLDWSNCGTYAQSLTVWKSLTILAPGVQLDGQTLNIGLQQGLLKIYASNVTVQGFDLTGSGGAGISIVGVSNVTVSQIRSHHNVQEGFGVWQVSGLRVTESRFDHNNMALTVDPWWEAGGGKIGGSSGIMFDRNEVDHNGGPGIWFDLGDTAATITENRAHDNWGPGIFYEITGGPGYITGNAVWANGFGLVESWWVLMSGIVLSNSSDVEVSGNTLAWNGGGIADYSMNRTDAPGPTVNNAVHDNLIVMGAPPSGIYSSALLFMTGPGGPDVCDGFANNQGYANRFWWSEPDPHPFGYQWCGFYDSLAAYANTPGGSISTMVTTAEMQAALTAAGIPLP